MRGRWLQNEENVIGGTNVGVVSHICALAAQVASVLVVLRAELRLPNLLRRTRFFDTAASRSRALSSPPPPLSLLPVL